MTVTSFKKVKTVIRKPKRRLREFIFIFENSHTLLDGILFLYRNKTTKSLKSRLYKLKNGYCLIIYAITPHPLFLHLKEFCKPTDNSSFSADYIKEYGKILIAEKAIRILGLKFFKDS